MALHERTFLVVVASTLEETETAAYQRLTALVRRGLVGYPEELVSVAPGELKTRALLDQIDGLGENVQAALTRQAAANDAWNKHAIPASHIPRFWYRLKALFFPKAYWPSVDAADFEAAHQSLFHAIAAAHTRMTSVRMLANRENFNRSV